MKLECIIVAGAGEVATGAGGEKKRRGDGPDGQGQDDGYRSSRQRVSQAPTGQGKSMSRLE